MCCILQMSSRGKRLASVVFSFEESSSLGRSHHAISRSGGGGVGHSRRSGGLKGKRVDSRSRESVICARVEYGVIEDSRVGIFVCAREADGGTWHASSVAPYADLCAGRIELRSTFIRQMKRNYLVANKIITGLYVLRKRNDKTIPIHDFLLIPSPIGNEIPFRIERPNILQPHFVDLEPFALGGIELITG